jgi:tetratricopeptide (TPR) repeat protein
MRLKTLILALLFGSGILIAAPAAQRQGALLPDDIGRRLAEQETRAQGVMETIRNLERIATEVLLFRRIANDEERAKIDAILSDMDLRGDTYRTQLQNINTLISEIRSGNCAGDCLAKIGNLQSQITSLNNQVQSFVAENRDFAAAFKKRIAVARRAAIATRRTDEMLSVASRAAQKTGNAGQAFAGLRRAFELQEDAKAALVDKHFEKSLKLTLRARDLIGEAVKEALDSADMASVKEQARRFYDNTNRMIDLAAARINAADNPRAARLLESARKEQSLAKTAYDEGKPYVALRHAQAARKIVTGIAQSAVRGRNADNRAERLSQKLDEATSIVEGSGNPQAQIVLDKATEHLNAAKDLLAAGAMNRAAAELDIAAKLGARAVDMAQGDSGGSLGNLDRQIATTGMIVQKAGAVAATDELKSRVEKARDLVRQAQAQKADASACLKLLDKATDIAFDVIAHSPAADAAKPAAE